MLGIIKFLMPDLKQHAKTWKFIELKVDPIPLLPKILMLYKRGKDKLLAEEIM